MNRPEFANEDVAIPPRVIDDGKAHIPSAPFHRLLRYKDMYYRIIQFEINTWSETQYRITIKATQPAEIFHEKIDCPEIDSDKVFVYEKMNFECLNFHVSMTHRTIDLDLVHTINQMIATTAA